MTARKSTPRSTVTVSCFENQPPLFSSLQRALMLKTFCLLIIFATLLVSAAGVASAQTVRTILFDNNDGSLTYQITSPGTRISCGARSTYAEWVFSGFVYNDAFGGTYPLSGSITEILSPSGQPGCPHSSISPNPLTLVGVGYTITFKVDTGLNVEATIQFDPNFINPKYVVVAVTYAPPGSGSSVNYTASSMFGTGTSIADSFSDTQSFSITVDTGIKAFKIVGGIGIQTSASTSYTQEKDDSTSISISKTTTEGVIVPGPASSAAGVDHDYDVIWIWLNPLINFTIPPTGTNTLIWRGYLSDAEDVPAMHIYGIQLGYLTGKWPIPPNVASVLARPWAANQIFPPGQGPGLTADDLLKIAALDPFSDPSYTVTLPSVPAGSTTSTDGRFTITDNQTVNFVPSGPGGQPTTQTYTESYATTQTVGQTAKYSTQQSYSIQEKFTLLKDILSFTFKESDTLTFGYQWSGTRTNTTGQSASLSVKGPAFADNYTGPTEFIVYQDNIFGTFMFYPVH